MWSGGSLNVRCVDAVFASVVFNVQVFYCSSVMVTFSPPIENSYFALCMNSEKLCHTYSQLLGIDTVHVRILLCYTV